MTKAAYPEDSELSSANRVVMNTTTDPRPAPRINTVHQMQLNPHNDTKITDSHIANSATRR